MSRLSIRMVKNWISMTHDRLEKEHQTELALREANTPVTYKVMAEELKLTQSALAVSQQQVRELEHKIEFVKEVDRTIIDHFKRHARWWETQYPIGLLNGIIVGTALGNMLSETRNAPTYVGLGFILFLIISIFRSGNQRQ